MGDHDVWPNAHPLDLWIYDKLILSSRLGYKCGPAGVPVPTPGYYIVRPVTNLLGMGIAAEIIYIDGDTDFIKPGHFWCEKFIGRHLSVDYVNQSQLLCVEGHRRAENPLWKWDKWIQTEDTIPFPNILMGLHNTTNINCEFIDGKLIEVHQRLNTDMAGHKEVIPVWKDEPTDLQNQGYTYYNDPDYYRVGFWKK